MYSKLNDTISFIQKSEVTPERIAMLRPLVEYIQYRIAQRMDVNINFICTHNSRRSHLCQVWAQIAAAYYAIPNVYCYSGGTEATALFPKIVETLQSTGIEVDKIADVGNPIYALKYDRNAPPIIGFSKTYDAAFNPRSDFVAVMTCSQADGDCPFILGAEKRIPITYEDPKSSDGTSVQNEVYAARSLAIATEMFFIFSQIK